MSKRKAAASLKAEAGGNDALKLATAAELRAKLREGDTKTERIELRLSKREKNLLATLAKDHGVSVAQLVVNLATFAVDKLSKG
ncbi:MAG: hypothetical protein GC159_08095 [Phycisphaera sp.]|nr:hypothetical protein [Phycisphaera sp.]